MKRKSQIVWEDPPPRQRGVGSDPWFGRLEPVKQRPNRWARVCAVSTNGAARQAIHRLRHGGVNIPRGKFEFEARGVYVYARYLKRK